VSVARISAETRRAVRQRAEYRCEYCRIAEADTEFGCEVDHIISEKHSGNSEMANLALACFFCNRNKGSDVGSILSPDCPDFVRFFNPRNDAWNEHFEFDQHSRIVAKTDIAVVTARILGFNTDHRVLERQALLGH
jgi:hypothetical protein